MKPESPNRKKPANAAEQMGRLYDRLVYWLYERQDARRARPFADRLEQLLASLGREADSIFGEECRALVHEAKGELAKAVRHRVKEIRLIRRLHRLAKNTDNEDFIFRQYSIGDLRDRLNLLAMLYHDRGDLEKAIATLEEAKELCEANGLRFDGKGLLQEYRKALPKVDSRRK